MLISTDFIEKFGLEDAKDFRNCWNHQTTNEIFSWAFKLGCNRQQPTFDEECIFEATSRQVTRVVNNTVVYEQMENFCSTFDHMYAFRSFVHWYNRFGMEEDEFAEARTHIEKLIREYKTIHILGE